MNKNRTINKFFQLKEKHHFHLVDQSQLPFLTAFAVMLLVLNIVFYLHSTDVSYIRFLDDLMFHSAWFFFSSALFVWFVTVVIEAGHGYHTIAVRKGLRYGMVLFIVSEIMFFFAFFWAFFHVSLAPSIAIGSVWPPRSIQSLDVWGLPLVNTLLLLSSGVTITLAHRAMLQIRNYSYFGIFEKQLLVTIILGLTFLWCQGIEYKYGITFRWKENIYGSTFFATTGFHGLHVTIGTIFLLFCLIRSLISSSRLHTFRQSSIYKMISAPPLKKRYRTIAEDIRNTLKLVDWQDYKVDVWNNWRNYLRNFMFVGQVESLESYLARYSFQKDQHLGFEAAAWYWHFVDVVWIFLFITVYWWGS